MNLDEIEARVSRRSNSFADLEMFNRYARTDVPALIARVRELEAECDEARAEVERLKQERDAACMAAGEYSQDEVNAMTTEMIAIRKWYEKNAYRRGAEAMREACAVLVSNEKRLWLRSELIADLRALPIPEES